MRSALTWVTALAAAGLIAVLGYAILGKHSQDSIESSLAQGKRVPAPLATLPRVNEDRRTGGTKASLADYRGQVVVLNVWASWCPSCRDELPLLERVHKQIRRRGGVVLGVATSDLAGDARSAMKKSKVTFPSVLDRDGEFGRQLLTTGVPETVLIDRHGQIAALQRGPVTDEWLQPRLRTLLSEQS